MKGGITPSPEPARSPLRLWLSVAKLRFALLVRQRLGWASAGAALLAVLVSMLFARVSFVNSYKIYWDFALGAIFLLQAASALYVGSQLFHEERTRRTLHLLVASGVPRGAWLAGNAAGIWAALLAANLLGLFLALLFSYLVFGTAPWLAVIETQVALAFEMGIVVWGAMLLSLVVRPALSFLGSAAFFFFLHSTGSIERILADRQTGRFIDTGGVKAVLWIAKVLPPLDWYDLRGFVGYRDSVGFLALAELGALALLWGLFLSILSTLRFKRMDL